MAYFLWMIGFSISSSVFGRIPALGKQSPLILDLPDLDVKSAFLPDQTSTF